MLELQIAQSTNIKKVTPFVRVIFPLKSEQQFCQIILNDSEP